MDYEKLHKDTITKLQEMVNSGKITVEIARGICADFIPENEDERIRKSLIYHYQGDGCLCTNKYRIDYKEIRAWLEKQGDQKPVVDDKDAEKASEEYRNFRMYCGIKDPVMLNEIEEAYYEGTIRKQKLSEWSEEDEKELESLIYELEINQEHISGVTYKIDWLKSLKDRVLPQPMQEWSEEDKNMLQSILDEYKSMPTEKRNWLKSLRPQNTWKPSEEQLKILDKIIGVLDRMQLFGGRNALIDLKHDLKKLRGE